MESRSQSVKSMSQLDFLEATSLITTRENLDELDASWNFYGVLATWLLGFIQSSPSQSSITNFSLL